MERTYQHTDQQMHHRHPESERGNCSTVIIGKDASVTGNFIVGHNEDDLDCVVQTHVVSRKKHPVGAVLRFDDGKAIIPQVEETYAYYWSEVRCKGGISFADSFVNEWGLVIVTDSCRPSRDATGCPKDNREDYGIGFALRRLVAERAKTAREAVSVIASLVEEFGYVSSRSYHLIDKDEAWIVQIPKGFRCVAKRLENDHVYYIPNWFTIHRIDFSDRNNYYWSEDLVTHAIEQGWYTPAVPGDWSDFDFAKAYQDGEMKNFNILRARNAWRLLTGTQPDRDHLKPFSVKAQRKYSTEDVKNILRSHYEGSPDDASEGMTKNPHRGYDSPTTICNYSTVESTIFELNDDKNLIRMLRTAPRPCLAPYTPWYPVALTRVPAGYEWIGPDASQAAHFTVDEEELSFDPAKAFWMFKALQYLTEFDYKNTHRQIHSSIQQLESRWEEEKPMVEAAYRAILGAASGEDQRLCSDGNESVAEAAARNYLTQYTCAQAQLSWDWAKRMFTRLGEERMMANVRSHEGDD